MEYRFTVKADCCKRCTCDFSYLVANRLSKPKVHLYFVIIHSDLLCTSWRHSSSCIAYCSAYDLAALWQIVENVSDSQIHKKAICCTSTLKGYLLRLDKTKKTITICSFFRWKNSRAKYELRSFCGFEKIRLRFFVVLTAGRTITLVGNAWNICLAKGVLLYYVAI